MGNEFSLTGKTALITGGASGIGYGIALEFVKAGANIVITDLSQEKLEVAKKQLGDNVFFFVNDVSARDETSGLIKHIENNIAPLDILVNNAGKHMKKPSLETTDEEFDSVINVNLRSVFSLTRETLKFMIPRGRGSVINISSMSAIFGLPEVSAYSSSKSGILGLTRTMASEYSYTGVRFNVIAPGFIESKMFRAIMDKDPEREKKILSRTPAGRLGRAEDIGKTAVFLASDASDFITGICIPVDGGNSIGF
jgi:NAD(P)-dependent dehydrogenase (short-subunit alcohol dehydrogenase family)